jgi:hypothetical protein
MASVGGELDFMPIDVERISDAQAEKIIQTSEGQFSDINRSQYMRGSVVVVLRFV